MKLSKHLPAASVLAVCLAVTGCAPGVSGGETAPVTASSESSISATLAEESLAGDLTEAVLSIPLRQRESSPVPNIFPTF